MISTEEQLRAAAERLGADVEDLQTLFPTRIKLSAPGRNFDSDSLTTHPTSVFHSDAINKALDESLFAICERAFGDSPSQGTSFSPSYSSPLSPPPLNPPQHADSNSAASASSSAAAAPIQTHSRAKSDILMRSCEHDGSSDDDSEPPSLRRTRRREAAQVVLSPKVILDDGGSRKDSSPQSRRPIRHSPNSRSPSHPTTPIGCILSFARGQHASLVDVSNLEKQTALCKMPSLSIITGCDKYSECSLFDYLGALFKAHLDLVQNLPKNQKDLPTANIDDLKTEMTETAWKTILPGTEKRPTVSQGLAENCPPMITSTMDLVQFSYRLVDKMSCAGDALTGRFLEGLYTSGTPKLVVSLTTRLLSSWADVWRKEASFPKQSLLLEWCLRLLVDFIVYELSPVSHVGHMKDFSPDAFVVFNLGRGGLPPLSVVVDYCFQFVSSHQVGKDCRMALCELVQAYLIWSTCPTPEGNAQAKLWTATREAKQEYLDSLIGKETFWTIVVQSALQQVKKLPQLADSSFEYTFLSSLVSISSAKRALFDDRQDKSKWMLLNVMIRCLELMNRDLLSCFLEAEGHRKIFPGIHTSIEFVHGLIASAAVQREILSADPTTKSRFLSSLESLIANSAKVSRYSHKVDEASEYAQKGPFAKIASPQLKPFEADSEGGDSRSGKKKGSAQMKATDRVLARQKAVAFAAKLIGCLGKSVEDGSWDMSQMNSIKALLHARINSSRSRRRLWNDIYNMQRSVERKIGTELLLSAPERNSFTMVVEVVRKHAACDSMDRNAGLSAQENSAGSQTIAAAGATRDIQACFPPVWEVSELQHSVCSAEGHIDFDNNRDMLMLLKDVLTERGQQILARYDSDSPFAVKWIRLQKRNAYIGGARELLDKSDRTVGQLCSCVPGYPKESGNGNENRVACSNDLCENRHMKIECVPGKCGAGTYCMNQRMQNLDYAKFKMVPFPGKGVGIVADEDIPEGALVGEYQGEVVTMDEYERRVQEYEGERHFYFMTLTSKLVIDASRKSQATRFLNHSCDPNSETQKWNADGEPRVGIFAKRAISKGEEITFDYGARSLARYSARCLCGAKNCRGLLAVRKEETCTAKDSEREGRTKDDDRVENMQEIGSKRSTGERRRVLEENRRTSVVKEKVETAKRYLREADALAKNSDEIPPFPQDSHFSDEMRQKVKDWKKSLREGSAIAAISEKGFEEAREEVRFPRIPRRSAFAAQSAKHSTEKGPDESIERNSSSRQLSAPRETDSRTVAQNPPSSMVSRRAPSGGRWALFEETVAGKLGDSQTPLKRQAETPLKRRAEGDSARRPSKMPRAGFLPTTSKLKRKPPLRPKFATRRRTREQDDNDSMGEYSTASEAEPVAEEPITSASRLPDGNGACSDDEFTAAPPVESFRFSPNAKQRNQSDHERRVYDERQMSRNDFGREGDQTRDGWRSGLESSHRLAWNQSDPNMQSHVRSRYGVQSPRTFERFRPLRADPRDVNAHESKPSAPMADHRRYEGYRREWSPSRERYDEPHLRKLGQRQQGPNSEDIVDRSQHARPPGMGTGRTLVRNADGTAHVAAGRGYPEIVDAPTLPDINQRRRVVDTSPSRHRDEDQDRSRIGAKDVDKPMSSKLGRANFDFRSGTRLDADRRANRRKEGIGRSLLDEGYVTLDKPPHERYEPNRFPRVVTSHSVGSVEARPRGDHRFTYHADKETRWVRRVERRDGVDLRNVIDERTRNKIR